ncbi:MAG TPA: hypothetical protein ENF36_06460 [Desulfobacteraceae bacterium]|nr:hypothetical protein [Desulfobacteraceae bacterium]
MAIPISNKMDLATQIESCMECEICLDVCQSYMLTQKQTYSPIARLKTAGKILRGERPAQRKQKVFIPV